MRQQCCQDNSSWSVTAVCNFDLVQLNEHIKADDKQRSGSIKVLKLFIAFDDSLGHNMLPVGLHTLHFGFAFSQSLSGIVLPTGLHTLILCCNPTDIVLPASLHTLSFFRDCSLLGVTLPSQLHTLEFGYYFDQPLNDINLPSSLHILTFGNCFNQSLIDIKFPPNLVIRKRGNLMCRTLLPPDLIIQYMMRWNAHSLLYHFYIICIHMWITSAGFECI